MSAKTSEPTPDLSESTPLLPDHLTASPSVSRRSFIKLVSVAGACLALGSFTALAGADENTKLVFAPNAFVKVDPDGTITVTINRSDMGQGVRTALAMLVAEEIDADWTKVKVYQAPGISGPGAGQGTGGSVSVRGSYRQLRQIGASARLMLIGAAAKMWNVDPSTCTTETGKVVHKDSKKSLSYGDLTTLATAIPVPEGEVPLKDKADFKIIGKAKTRIDNPHVVDGTAIYGIDAKVDGMVYAVLARRPSFGAILESFDDTAARKVPGVTDIVKLGNSVAVIATNTWAAMQGRKALNIKWNQSANADLTTQKVRDTLKAAVVAHQEMPAGSKVVEASYEFPYLAHATMEPMNALADVKEDSCNVWASTQSPTGAQRQVAQILGIPQEKVVINVCLLGGGFGRRLSNDYIAEAVQISKAIKKPVKLTWSRDDDMQNDNYRPASHNSLKAALDSSGNPVGWSHEWIQAGGRASERFGNPNMPYDIPGAAMLSGGAPIPVPNGAWRSVENTLLTPANECFIDELAAAAGQDPLAFRLKLLKNERLKKVLQTAADKAGWGKPMPKGQGRGIACFAGYGSFAAHVVELTVVGQEIKLNRVVAVVDCGMAINPKGVEAQMQGACVDGLSTALRSAITLDKGAVQETSWYDFQWMTIDAMPKIEVHIIAEGADPGGMGEVGYPSVMPAVANAVAMATGKRVRRFPIKLEEVV